MDKQTIRPLLVLGAFVAGAVVSTVDRDVKHTHPLFRVKLDAIGYGFLIPVFFVASGLRLDLAGLVDDPAALRDGLEDIYPGDVAQDIITRFRESQKALERELWDQ